MTVFALQFFLAPACKCQVMLSPVWFPLTRLRRSRPKKGMNREKMSQRESLLISLLQSAYNTNVCKMSIL